MKSLKCLVIVNLLVALSDVTTSIYIKLRDEEVDVCGINIVRCWSPSEAVLLN
jgi:hypothetical protein